MRQRVKYWCTAIHWIFNDKLHRDGYLPSSYYFYDGKLLGVDYYQNNKHHRTTGPAYIDYEYKTKLYYYQGRMYDSLEQMLMIEACR